MNKIKTLLLLITLITTTIPIHAQLNWGIEVGVNQSKANVKNDGGLYDSYNRTGWFIGPKVQLVMPVIGIGIDAAILYSQKHIKLQADGSSTQNKNLSSIEIPINLRYNYSFNPLIGLYAATGPQYNRYINSRSLRMSGQNIGQIDRNTYSWNIGVGAILLSHIQIGLNYNIAMNHTGDVNNPDNPERIFDVNNNTWQVRMSYLF